MVDLPCVCPLNQINYLHCFWPALLRRDNFLSVFITPLIKAFPPKASLGVQEFFSLPQFEAWRAEVGKGGIVRDAQVRTRVVRDLCKWVEDYPVTTVGTIPSPLPGRDGNEEFLWLLQKK